MTWKGEKIVIGIPPAKEPAAESPPPGGRVKPGWGEESDLDFGTILPPAKELPAASPPSGGGVPPGWAEPPDFDFGAILPPAKEPPGPPKPPRIFWDRKKGAWFPVRPGGITGYHEEG